MLRDATIYRDLVSALGLEVAPPEQGARWVVDVDRHRNGDYDVPPDSDVVLTDSVVAIVTRGSWMVRCPCMSAALACRTDHRFFCVSCHNIAVGGRWLAVEWPKETDAIEEILGQRFYRINQNWETYESIQDLREENAANNQAVAR